MEAGEILRLEHHPPNGPAKKKLVSAYDLAQVGFFLFGFPRNGFGSIDVTHDCNLRCRHCYFFEHDQPQQSLSTTEWIELFEHWKRTRSRLEFPFFQCSWVGGEPLIRKDVIEAGRRYFRYNTIVTNGTIPLPDWPDVNWYVSIDGDEEMHEHIRNKKGIYRRIMKHVSARPHNRITVAYCITRENAHCIETVVRDWSKVARYFTFDFYTPMEGADDPLWVPWAERDRILDQLLALHRIYRGYFRIPERTFRLMRSDLAPDVTRTCLFARKAFAYDAVGRLKKKCVMGEKADCGRCGCVVPYYMRSLTDRPMVVRDLAGEAWRGAMRRWGTAP
ncbi:MAG TPA: radical SAM protein [Polyangia bacterium]|jgi:MoaA/NifB/PqqE/SkfB family radical SAM enzyme